MPEPSSDPFPDGGRWKASPHLYDYVHLLHFNPRWTPMGTVELVDGGGQALSTLVRARFAAKQLTSSTFLLSFTDVVELDPYYKSRRFRGLELDAFAKAIADDVPFDDDDVRSRPEPFSIQVTREDGLFPMRQQVIWKIRDEQEWPCLLFCVRYRFAFDPLAAFVSNRHGILYFERSEQLEIPEPDTRVYFREQDGQRRTALELAQAGIALEDELS